MTSRLASLVRLLALAGGLAGAALAGAGAAPLEAYGRLPSIEQAALSPSGGLIAIAQTDGEKRTVTIVRAGSDELVVRLRAGDSKIRGLAWAGDNHVLITASRTAELTDVIAPRAEWYTALDYNLKTGASHTLLEDAKGVLGAVYGEPDVRIVGGKPYAFVEASTFVGEEGRLSLFRIDLDAAQSKQLGDGWPNTEGWVIDSAGQPLAESEYAEQGGHWALKVLHGADWRQAASVDTKYGFGGFVGLGRDGKSVLESEEGQTGFREFDVEAQTWGQPFGGVANAAPLFDHMTGRAIGVYGLDGDDGRYQFFSAQDQAAWDATLRAFKGQTVSLLGLSADHRKLLVQVESPTEAPAIAFIDLDANKASYVATVYDDLKPGDVAPVRSLAFKAADGTPLTGYLTLPNERPAKALPLIVFPHGGPATRDEPGFDWWAQAMASRGYAVLQVNYRGSTGFGAAFREGGYGQWGRKMQTDLSDSVRYLAAEGTIDPKRVCIVGGSYGGYAALAGATLDPGVYRCAVSVAGISDLRPFVAWSLRQNDVSAQRYFDRFVGAKGPNDPRLDEVSPADHIGAATPPILLIHGKDDTVVPFEQSQIMADALKRAGKPVEMVVLRREDHWLSHGETRLQMLQATMDFVEKNNPAQ
jgi:dipeptidyl aminopeptidase/acylaminoacyl peptidase